MSRISDEDIERIRAASDLISLVSERTQVKKAGRRYKACCPIHSEKTPSFFIDPDTNLWHCFGCGQGGDVFKYVMLTENLDFPDSVRYLAQRHNIDITQADGPARPKGFKERLRLCMEESAAFYHRCLMRSSAADAAKAREYLGGRGMGSQVCKRWNLGYAPGHTSLVDHLQSLGFSQSEMISANVALQGRQGRLRDRFFERVMFPIQDRLGNTIAFGGRIIGQGEPKYLNTSDTPLFTKSGNLYGIAKAKDAITARGMAIVCEGYTDTIALHEAGFSNAVATLGTALTSQHLRILKSLRPKKVVYLFDGDSAGQKAADRAVEFIDRGITPESGADYMAFEVAVLPGGSDPAEFLASRGPEALERELSRSEPLIRFAIDRRIGQWDLSDPIQKSGALRDSVQLLAPIKASIVAADYANYIADRLGCPQETVLGALKKARPAAKAPRREASSTSGAVASERVGSKGAVAVFYRIGDGVQSDALRSARECLALALRSPECLKRLKKVGEGMRWPDPMSQALADAMCEADGTSDLAAWLEREVPGACAYLSASTLGGVPDEQVRDVFSRLFTQVREHDLLNRIRSGNARLKEADGMSDDEYDTLFRNVSALQEELKRLRNDRQ